MTILVTGATGLLGNNIVRLLLEKGEAVRVLVRENADERPLEGLEVERITGDIREAERVQAACQGTRAVIHSAALVTIGWTRLEEARAINVIGTQHVAAAARAANAKLVHVSSVDAMAPGRRDQPANEDTPGKKIPCTYVVTKTESESAVFHEIDAGLEAVIVNPGFMLGPWDWKPSSGRMLLEVAKRFTPLAPPGGLSLCDVRDVAESVITSIHAGQSGRRYILAGHNTTFFDAWKLFAKVAGVRPPRAKVWRGVARLAGWGGDLWGKISRNEPDINSAAVWMSNIFHYYSSSRAAAELNYANRPAAESAEAAWQWFKEHGYA